MNTPIQAQMAVDLEGSVKLPYILTNKILMSPGIWNDFYYSADAIKEAFSKTNWDSKSQAVFLDHDDNKTSEWIGEVKNLRYEDGDVIGDLVIVDKDTAIKLAYGAKFGISPKVVGESDNNRRIHDFTFANMSVVINPAVKKAYLNSEITKKGGSMGSVEDSFDTDMVEMTDKEMEKLAEKVASIMAKKKMPEEALPVAKCQDAPAEKVPTEDEPEKKKEPLPPEEMSDALLSEIFKNSAYTDFVKKYVADNPDMPIKEAMKKAAEEFKKQAPEAAPAENSEESITQLSEKITAKLSEQIDKKIKEILDNQPTRVTERLLESEPRRDVSLSSADGEMFKILRGDYA